MIIVMIGVEKVKSWSGKNNNKSKNICAASTPDVVMLHL